MRRAQLEIDDDTAGRLLDGLPSDDAPPGYHSVARALEALRRPGTEQELAGEASAVATITRQIAQTNASHPPSATNPPRTPRRIVVFGVVGAAVLFGGLASAGALPGHIQDVAAKVFDVVGLNVADSNAHVEPRPADSVTPDPAPTADDTQPRPGPDRRSSNSFNQAHSLIASAPDGRASVSQPTPPSGGTSSADRPANTPATTTSEDAPETAEEPIGDVAATTAGNSAAHTNGNGAPEGPGPSDHLKAHGRPETPGNGDRTRGDGAVEISALLQDPSPK